MSKLIKKYKTDFTILDNYVFKDKRLSYKELGLLNQLLSLPDNWEFNVKGLAGLHKDGENSVKAGLVKLEEYGYLTRIRIRGGNGQLSSSDYYIYDNPNENIDFLNKNGLNKGVLPRDENHPMAGYSPVDDFPPVDNPPVEKPPVDNPANKEYINKLSIYNSTSTNDLTKIDEMIVNPKQYKEINELIQMIALNEIKSSKSDLFRFLHKIYDEEKHIFIVRGVEIKDLVSFVESTFNQRTHKQQEDNKVLKSMADQGDELAKEIISEHPSRFRNL